MDKETLQKVYEKIAEYEQAMIDLQTKLTAIPALGPENDGEGEEKKAAFLKSWMERELEFDSLEEYNAPDDRVPCGYRPNIVAKVAGESSARTIWIMGHTDIVPPGDLEKWETDPYQAVVKDGKLIGRGIEDNQQAIVTSLFALKALAELGIKPKHDIGLAFVADEETGSKYGLDYVIEKTDLFGKDDYIIVPDAGSPDSTMIEVAEKSIYWLRVETKGKQCHASTPEAGINAHRAAAHLITRIDELYKIFDQRDEVFDPPISTFEPTKKEANVPNVNTIPGDDVFYVDMRVLPDIPLADVDAKIAEMVKAVEQEFTVTITTSSPQREDAAPPTPADAPVVVALAAAVKDIYGVEAKAMGIGGGTVAAFFRRAGFPAVVWATLDDMAHQPNEFTRIESMVGDTKVFANLFLQD